MDYLIEKQQQQQHFVLDCLLFKRQLLTTDHGVCVKREKQNGRKSNNKKALRKTYRIFPCISTRHSFSTTKQMNTLQFL